MAYETNLTEVIVDQEEQTHSRLHKFSASMIMMKQQAYTIIVEYRSPFIRQIA